MHSETGDVHENRPTLIDCTFSYNRSADEGGAMYNRKSSPTLIRCILVGNIAGGDGGGMYNRYYNDPASTLMSNCIFVGNLAGGAGGGIYNSGPLQVASTLLTNCTFAGNSASNGNAIACDSYDQRWPSDFLITNCILWDGGNEIWNNDGSTITITYSDVQGAWPGQGNIEADPCFVDPGYWDSNGTAGDVNDDYWVDGDYHLLPGSPCIDAGDPNYVAEPNETDLDGKPRVLDGDGDGTSVVDMGAYEHRIIHVDTNAPGANEGSSWADAFNYLQDALTAAAGGDEIRVAQGIYKPDQGAGVTPGDRTATFQLINAVAIKGGYGGFSEPDPNVRDIYEYETILSGDLSGNDAGASESMDLLIEPSRDENSFHVVTGTGTGPSTILDGFTISGGNANGSYPAHNGGGMYNKYGASPTVVNCTFRRNSARSRGGGMYVSMYSDPVLSHCVFIGNEAETGGGLYSSGGSEKNICEPTLINCVFSGNLATEKAGGMDSHGRATLVGCTFSGNSGESGVGGMFDLFGRATLTNCILWGNTGGGTGESAQIQTFDTHVGETEINYCCIEGWTGLYGGVGNMGDDPLFVDADGADNIPGTDDDNPRLLPDSSCLDAGDNDSVPADSLDLDGDGDVNEAMPFDMDRNQRFVDETGVPDTGNGVPPIVDIGAYESINQGFLLSTQSIIVGEGGTATFTVALAIDPCEG
ncbi:MAG: choice-of-anchor Q domain-containing protein, partial [Planctomycetota bacterium]